MSPFSAVELLSQLEALDENEIASLPPDLRIRLQTATRNASLALKSPAETISRILIQQPAEAVIVRVAADLGLFSALESKALTSSELALVTGAQPVLLRRMLRGLAAFRAVKQVGLDHFTASPGHSLLQRKDFQAAFGPCQAVLDRIRQSLPAFLAATQYKCPEDTLDTAIQYAYGTKGKSFYESILSDVSGKVALQSFAVLTSAWAEGFTQIQDIYPVKERLEKDFGTDPTVAVFVDVGGGFGQKAIALKKAFPTLPGRFIVQDLERRIDGAKELKAKHSAQYHAIELMSHNYLTEQPVKGARCYYIRQCMHNWQDSGCITILRHLKDAATPGYSRILIHDIIVPEKGAGPWIVSQDIEMLSFFGSGERTEGDWRRLCEEAGLKVAQVYLNDHPSCDGIVEINV